MVFPCSRCGLQFSRKWNLSRHLKKCFLSDTVSVASSDPEEPSNISEDDDDSVSKHSMVKRMRFGKEEDLKYDDDTGSAQNNEEIYEETQKENEETDEEKTDDDQTYFEDDDEEDEECETSDNAVNETESSEDEDDDEPKINMNESQEQKTKIRWPISNKYKVYYPWSFWGETPRIKKHVRWLERITDSENHTVVYNIRNGTDSQIAALCEIAYNYLHFQMPAERNHLKEIRKHKRAVRLLANPDVDIADKRKELLRRGAGFVQLIIEAIDPILNYNIPRQMQVEHSEITEEDKESEGEENE